MEVKKCALSANRKKKNLGFYKEVCKLLEEKECKKNSPEKVEQLKRWETEYNIFKNKDSSFTFINKEFRTIKEICSEEHRIANTVKVGNHEVFIGRNKFSPKKIKNIDKVFLNYISRVNYDVESKYVNGFWQDCALEEVVKQTELEKLNPNKEECDNEKKIQYFVCDLFKSKTYKFFKYFLDKSKEHIDGRVYYVDYLNKELDFEVCTVAKNQAIGELKICPKDRLKHTNEINKRANTILREQGKKEFRKKKTIYSIKDKNNIEPISREEYVYTMTLICEVMRCYLLRQIDKYKKGIGVGVKTFDLQYAYYKMSREDLIAAENMVEGYLIFVDADKCASYYSIDDIQKTDFEQ